MELTSSDDLKIAAQDLLGDKAYLLLRHQLWHGYGRMTSEAIELANELNIEATVVGSDEDINGNLKRYIKVSRDGVEPLYICLYGWQSSYGGLEYDHYYFVKPREVVTVVYEKVL